ncbi:unnamed protein product [Calicophoron daubneyi]|uniref:Anaphase-promoting complex subunit 4-like WD40 domain-containing protein n=1 Tax=Calicophoron daubneyi TaxID=300641 RepID=A0AAV2TWS0_CALDB
MNWFRCGSVAYMWTSLQVDLNQSRAQEPTYLLLPNRLSRPSAPSIGPCTSLVPIKSLPGCSRGSSDEEIYFASGHLNGWIVLWSLIRNRASHQWLAHPNSQVTALQYWPREQTDLLLSQGRDGFIRFWSLALLDHLGFDDPLPQALSEIHTCTFTFCPMCFWSSAANSSADLQPGPDYYLAHVRSSEGATEADNIVEVIKFPDNVIVADTSMLKSEETFAGFSKLGMCMALQGVPVPRSSQEDRLPQCIVVVGYESGDVVVYGDGVVIARLEHVLGQGIPVLTLSLQPHSPGVTDEFGGILAIGGPSIMGTPAKTDLTFASLICSVKLGACSLSCLTRIPVSENCGISSFAWRSDGKILAVGQWNGEIRLFEAVWQKTKAKLRPFGCLTSLGGLNEGGLLGEWASTTVSKPHGPTVDQQSTSIRACLFTPVSNWLITAAPANAGAVGSILVWDVYRK